MKHFSFIITFYTGRYEFSNEGTAILMCAALVQWTVKTKTHPSIVYFMSRFRGTLSSGAHPFNCSCRASLPLGHPAVAMPAWIYHNSCIASVLVAQPETCLKFDSSDTSSVHLRPDYVIYSLRSFV